MLHNNAPPQQPGLKWQENHLHQEIQKFWYTCIFTRLGDVHDHQIIKPWQKHNAVLSEPHNLSTCGLASVHETASTIENDAAIKPIVSICVPLIEAPRHWMTSLCPKTQEHHTHIMLCFRNWQPTRNGRPNKQKNGFEMHIGYENPSHRKSQNTP